MSQRQPKVFHFPYSKQCIQFLFNFCVVAAKYFKVNRKCISMQIMCINPKGRKYNFLKKLSRETFILSHQPFKQVLRVPVL